MAAGPSRQPQLPIEGKTVRAMVSLLAKRSHAQFQGGTLNQEDEAAVLRARYSPCSCTFSAFCASSELSIAEECMPARSPLAVAASHIA